MEVKNITNKKLKSRYIITNYLVEVWTFKLIFNTILMKISCRISIYKKTIFDKINNI